jgi:hypothetical protein
VGTPFARRSEFGKNEQQRGCQLFDKMDIAIANPDKPPGAMPMICLEISQFGDSPHAMMNQFQHGVTISILQFWSTLCCYLNKTVSAVGLTNTMTTILLLASSARISTP